jgi:DNA-binding transcriptional MerR regulator
MIGGFYTIGEAALQVAVPPHVLRFWESRISHIQPHKRGRWRYYRPKDIDLLRRIRGLLHDSGYTIDGVQRLLDAERGRPAAVGAPIAPDARRQGGASRLSMGASDIGATLRAMRDTLVALRKTLERT